MTSTSSFSSGAPTATPTPIPLTMPWIGESELAAVTDVLASGWLTQGPRVEDFERRVAERLDARHAIATSSCTTALADILTVVGIGPGDEVVVPSFSFIATTAVVMSAGARPIFADIDPMTGNVDASTVAPCIGPNTTAVLGVHQAGVPLDLEPLRRLCASAGVPLIEDAACALGSTYRFRPVGSDALFAALSFHPRKVITTGEGGMILTSDADASARLRRLRDHGSTASASTRHQRGGTAAETYSEIGSNHRLTDLQAAIGLAQMDRLATLLDGRRRRARRYQEMMARLPGVVTVTDPAWGTGTFQSFWIRLLDADAAERDRVMDHLATRGITTRRGIMCAHRQPALTARPHDWEAPQGLVSSETLSDTSIVMPLWHTMTDSDQDRVVSALEEALA